MRTALSPVFDDFAIYPAISNNTQVSDSIKMKACIKNCIINQCMRGSEKATPAKCYIPCKIMCDPKKDGQEIADPNVYRNPVVRFCLNFGWIFGSCKKA
ncbi:hypothetical protein YC2023_102100 [Brassica napus]